MARRAAAARTDRVEASSLAAAPGPAAREAGVDRQESVEEAGVDTPHETERVEALPPAQGSAAQSRADRRRLRQPGALLLALRRVRRVAEPAE